MVSGTGRLMALSMMAAVALAGGASELLAQGQTGRANRPVEVITPPAARAGGNFEEVTIKADAVIGIRLETALSSSRTKVEDRVTGRVTRDVTVNERTAIPAGTHVEGFVTVVERGGRLKDPARIGIRFTTIVLGDEKTRLAIQTEPIYRTADSPGSRSAARIGTGAVMGAILGALIGGKKGAVIGGTAGAGAGTATVAASNPEEVLIPAGTPLTVRLSDPVTVLIERQTERR